MSGGGLTIAGTDCTVNLVPAKGYLPAQLRATELIEDPAGPTYVLLSGGMGAGKSYWLAWEVYRLLFMNLSWAIANGYQPSDVKGLVLSPTLKLFKKSLAPTMNRVMLECGLAGRYRWNHQDGILRLDVGGGLDHGPLIYAYTSEEPDTIIGSDVCVMGVDEPGTPKKGDAFFRCAGRLRGPGLMRKGPMAGTPEDIVSREWLYEFIASPRAQSLYGEHGTDEQDPNSRRIVFGSTRENTFIPNVAGYVRGMQAVFTRQQQAAYIDGQFVAFNADRVYQGWVDRDLDAGGHRIPEGDEALLRPGRGSMLLVSLDFNVNPMCGVVAFRHGIDGVRVTDEIRIENAGDEEGKTPITRWCDAFRSRYLDRSDTPWEGPVYVYGDATEKKKTVAATTTGWRLVHETLGPIVRASGWDYHQGQWGSNPREKDRVNTVNAAFEQGRVLVAERCHYLRKDLNLVAWKQPLKEEIDKTDGALTHLSDALGYLVLQHLNFVANRAQVGAPLPLVLSPAGVAASERWDW